MIVFQDGQDLKDREIVMDVMDEHCKEAASWGWEQGRATARQLRSRGTGEQVRSLRDVQWTPTCSLSALNGGYTERDTTRENINPDGDAGD